MTLQFSQSIHEQNSLLAFRLPTLPTVDRVIHAPRFICGQRWKKRKQEPAPVSVRPKPELPPLPTIPARHASLAAPTDKRRELYRAAGRRRDLVVKTYEVHEPGSIATALEGGRELREHTLIITTTRDSALIAAQEARLVCKGAPVIVAAGARVPGGWQHPAINANSRKEAVIVIASVRAVLHDFLLSGHGRPFLKKIKFLIVSDVTGIIDVAADKCLSRILKNMNPKELRKTIVFRRPSLQLKHRAQKLNTLVDNLVRDNKEEIKWNQFKEAHKPAEAKVTYGGDLKLVFPSDVVHEYLQKPTARKNHIDFSNLETTFHNVSQKQAKRLAKAENIDDVTRQILSIPDEIPVAEATIDVTNEKTEVQPTLPDFGLNGVTKIGSAEDQRLNEVSEKIENVFLNESNEITIDQKSMLRMKESVDITEKIITGSWSGCYETLCSMLVQKKKNHEEEENEEATERVVVIFPTARLAECYVTMARVDGFDVQDVHRRMTSARRERGLEWMFSQKRANLFATDAVAKTNTVIPRVDRLIHFGAPSHVDEYRTRFHLLRDGGLSVLLLGDRQAESILEKLVYSPDKDPNGMIHEKAVHSDRVWKDEKLDMKVRGKAYLSWISFWRLKRPLFKWVARDVLEHVNEWAVQTFGEVPIVPSNIARKLQLRKFDTVKVQLVEVPPPRKRQISPKPKSKKKKAPPKADKTQKGGAGLVHEIVMSKENAAAALTNPW